MPDRALTTAPTKEFQYSGSQRAVAVIQDLGPGIALTSVIAAGAYALRNLPGIAVLSPLILAILLGIILQNTIGTPARAKAGVLFSARRILRAAIVLLGLQITAQQVVQVGVVGLVIVVVTLAATFLLTKALGRWLGVDPELAELIAAGTSICGASAVIATNTVTDGRDEDVAYAVGCVTLFGTMSMFLYPLFGSGLGLEPHAYGLWAGASIHEIAQVVAAAYQHGNAAGEFGTISKLSRVMLLAPLVGLLGWTAARRCGPADDASTGRRGALAPPFVLSFLALIAVNSVGLVPQGAKQVLVPATVIMLTVSLAALGLETDIRKLRAMGARPLLLAASASLFISGFSLALIMLAE